MNLSPAFIELFDEKGIDAHHWLEFGDPRTSDADILDFAKKNNFIILTHDLDFGSILAAGKSNAPSVLQLRTQNILPAKVIQLLLKALEDFASELNRGALITIDKNNARARILPIE